MKTGADAEPVAGRYTFFEGSTGFQSTIWLKVPKCEIFDLQFFTLINLIWVGDSWTRKKSFILKIEADIRNFVFGAHAECTLKMNVHAECAQKKFSHTQYAYKNFGAHSVSA